MPQYGPTDEQNQEYTDLQEEIENKFKDIGSEYKNGNLSSDEFEKKMRDAIIDHLTALAVLGKGGELDEDDIDDLTDFTDGILDLLEEYVLFVRNPDEFSEDYLRWRSGLYSNARQVFMRFTMPRDIWIILPEMPGDNCLGDGKCGCSWDISVYEDGTIEATWVLGDTFHCEICISNSIEYSPYVISAGDQE
jgi:hypothetical protein